MTVKVFDVDGRALNDCHPARARQLVNANRAKVISRSPYTIQLIQPVANATKDTRDGQSPTQEAS
ncbi:RRXRR domain-containing protein [Methylocaldum szegediense]|jgi:hypothetical protein|uniref:RRXRR domain-containing protein n=1 Tax=Methylocaldum szegediense TaxID=73780 RepID=UPI00047EFB7A|nr:RRXRR domain-containing protein [Methylocaldum szegediense]